MNLVHIKSYNKAYTHSIAWNTVEHVAETVYPVTVLVS